MRLVKILFFIVVAIVASSCFDEDFGQKLLKTLDPGKNTLVSTNGAYELSELVKFMMVDSHNDDRLSDGRDYNDFKEIARDIRRVEKGDRFPGEFYGKVSRGDNLFRGTTKILVDGKRLLAENIEDDYDWGVYVSGPKIEANVVSISSSRPVRVGVDAGANYFRKARFRLIPLICYSQSSLENTSNYEALYLILYPGKAPAFFSISTSTGSGGHWVSYVLHYGPVAWYDVALGHDSPDRYRAPLFGECRVKGA